MTTAPSEQAATSALAQLAASAPQMLDVVLKRFSSPEQLDLMRAHYKASDEACLKQIEAQTQLIVSLTGDVAELVPLDKANVICNVVELSFERVSKYANNMADIYAALGAFDAACMQLSMTAHAASKFTPFMRRESNKLNEGFKSAFTNAAVFEPLSAKQLAARVTLFEAHAVQMRGLKAVMPATVAKKEKKTKKKKKTNEDDIRRPQTNLDSAEEE